MDLVNHPSGVRLFPVGRLDMDTSGLLLLTNDGDLANRLTHPRYHLQKVYELTVRGSLDETEVRRLEQGLFLGDRSRRGVEKTGRSRLKLLKRDRNRTHLIMDLREGRNRQIRRMLARVGHPVKRLRRIQIGPLRLKGLRVGEWREPTSGELAALKRAAYRGSRKTRKDPTLPPATRSRSRQAGPAGGRRSCEGGRVPVSPGTDPGVGVSRSPDQEPRCLFQGGIQHAAHGDTVGIRGTDRISGVGDVLGQNRPDSRRRCRRRRGVLPTCRRRREDQHHQDD